MTTLLKIKIKKHNVGKNVAENLRLEFTKNKKELKTWESRSGGHELSNLIDRIGGSVEYQRSSRWSSASMSNTNPMTTSTTKNNSTANRDHLMSSLFPNTCQTGGSPKNDRNSYFITFYLIIIIVFFFFLFLLDTYVFNFFPSNFFFFPPNNCKLKVTFEKFTNILKVGFRKIYYIYIFK